MDVYLSDKNPDVIKAWRSFFDRAGRVKVHEGDVFDLEVSAVVLPINSFGIMEDGLAEDLNKRTDGLLESRSRKLIAEKHSGELPVGNAEVLTSGIEKPRLVVLAPTTRVPQRTTAAGLNAYLATRAALRAVAAYIRDADLHRGAEHLDSIAFGDLGQGTGLPPATSAFQMYEAYCQIVLGQLPNFATVEAATAHDVELKKQRFV
jgi:O-acetyl-ADP-ribose deacetylase (regulator of RNase III)